MAELDIITTDTKDNNKICKYNTISDSIYVTVGYVTYLYLNYRVHPIDYYSPMKLFALINLLTTPLHIYNMIVTRIECKDTKENTDFTIDVAAAITITQIIPTVLIITKVYQPAVFLAYIGYNLISEDNKEYFSTNLRESMEYLRKNANYFKEDFIRLVIEFAEKESRKKVIEAKEMSDIALKVAEEASNTLSDFKNNLSDIFYDNEETVDQEVDIVGKIE